MASTNTGVFTLTHFVAMFCVGWTVLSITFEPFIDGADSASGDVINTETVLQMDIDKKLQRIEQRS